MDIDIVFLISYQIRCINIKIMNQTLNFNFKRVSEYIDRLDQEVNQIRVFSKRFHQAYEYSNKEIIKIQGQKNQAKTKIRDQEFKKQFNNIQYIEIQNDIAENNIKWVNQQLAIWVEGYKENIVKLKQMAKKLQSKRLNKALKDQEINQFKQLLKERALESKKSIEEIIVSISHWNLQKCVLIIEYITRTMKRIKEDEKKKKNQKRDD